MIWQASAPSNIALIKYMGKIDPTSNRPTNPSLSYTLPHFTSTVTLTLHDAEKNDSWEPLTTPEILPTHFSDKAIQRFLTHLTRIRQYYQHHAYFTIRSGNNFPAACGLASSASSFAALTQVACLALSELSHRDLPSLTVQSQWSRQGSGSSCRSFFPHWALWQEEYACAIELPFNHLRHTVILIDSQDKKISSSEAHQAVLSSPLFATRASRAKTRLDALLTHLQCRNWAAAYGIVWAEFMDMHELFETADPSFRYITPQGHEILNFLSDYWKQHHDGPLVTMDAGPNIHLLYRDDQTHCQHAIKNALNGHVTLLEDTLHVGR